MWIVKSEQITLINIGRAGFSLSFEALISQRLQEKTETWEYRCDCERNYEPAESYGAEFSSIKRKWKSSCRKN